MSNATISHDVFRIGYAGKYRAYQHLGRGTHAGCKAAAQSTKGAVVVPLGSDRFAEVPRVARTFMTEAERGQPLMLAVRRARPANGKPTNGKPVSTAETQLAEMGFSFGLHQKPSSVKEGRSEYGSRCQAVTRGGTQCKNRAVDGSSFCATHKAAKK